MRFLTQVGIVFLAALTATITEAQSTPQARVKMAAAKPPASVPEQPQTPPAVPQVASSLLDQPARPADVQLNAGKLSVKADNSTLSGILHEISTKTGMTVDGLSRDQRIFGDYGPAAPREVLSALLDGVGYNVMMVGTLASGAPRELTLTPRTGGGATTPGNHSMQMARQNSNGDDDDDSSVPDQQDNSNNIPPRPEATPAEANQPPQDQQQQQQQPSTNPNQSDQPGQVKTPQQMLQELQQMRQKQLQMQQQQQGNPQ